MNRNVESHFGNIPSKTIRRSKLKRDFSHKTTFNTGEIIPIYADEVLPGDTVKLRLSQLIRMATPLDPVMDNAWIDTYFFFVPRRLVWDHWKEFMGENTTDAWTQETEYEIPALEIPEGGFSKGTIGEKIYGIQGRGDGLEVDACYTRAYTLIFNEWMRSQNVTEPAELSKGDVKTVGKNGTNYVTDLQKGGYPAKAVKYADYFTRALPEPQKGPDVFIPLSSQAVLTGSAPIVGDGSAITFRDAQGTEGNAFVKTISAPETTIVAGVPSSMHNNSNLGLTTDKTKSHMTADISGLSVDLQGANGATINQLRQAYAIQKMYEIDARSGTRYTEVIRSHFGILSPDGRQQRPEYLGGKRVPINMTQVIQQSETGSTPMGDTAAMSLTIDNHDMFTQSFTEHGIIMGLAVVRTEHTYQQGINRIFNRKNRFDFYWPALSNIGEQYIKNKELFAQASTEAENEEAFGYQEAWAEYRYGVNKITGELNSDYTTPLDSWHYGDDYSELPTLSDAWIRETDTNVARTLAVTTQDQFIADFYFDQTWTRPMPIYSVPGLTGWH